MAACGSVVCVSSMRLMCVRLVVDAQGSFHLGKSAPGGMSDPSEGAPTCWGVVQEHRPDQKVLPKEVTL